MTIIYSNKEIDSLSGQYVEPFRFSGVEKGITKVYTDDSKIESAYKDAGIEVSPISSKEDKPLPKKQNKVVS